MKKLIECTNCDAVLKSKTETTKIGICPICGCDTLKIIYEDICETCSHQICPQCKLGCHNLSCEQTVRPTKNCYDILKEIK